MKIEKLITAAIAVCSFWGSTAIAAPYVAGDLLIGFHATGGTGASTDLIVNIGSSVAFRNGTLPATLASLGTNLNATYGASGAWFSRTDLYWGVIGIRSNYDPDFGTVVGGDPSGTLYASFNSTTTPANIDAAYTSFAGFANQFLALASTVSEPKASLTTTTQIWNVQNPEPGGASFGGALPNIEKTLAGSKTLAVYRYLSDTVGDTYGGSVGQPSFIRNISIDSNGNLSAVPEPSTYALMGFGAIAIFVIRRRQLAKA